MIKCLGGGRGMGMFIRRYVVYDISTSSEKHLTLNVFFFFSWKAYLEFFVKPALLTLLLSHIERDGNITYYVINKRGDLRTNTHSDGPNAVTWGVFPGKEIVQPTIVEAVSFMAWKVRIFLFFFLSTHTPPPSPLSALGLFFWGVTRLTNTSLSLFFSLPT